MKKYFIFAASALALAGCQSDEFLGEVPGNVKEGASSAINIGGEIGKVTRADHVGADAANLLNKQFIVAGFKGEKSAAAVATTKVFDHYVVKWEANTAGTTDDNTSDWKYVGETPETGLTELSGTQTIKYWDYAVGQYDFIAFSYGNNALKTGSDEPSGDSQVKITRVTPSSATTSAYTIKGTKEALQKCYIADLITAYNPEETGKPKFKDEVKPVFRNLTSKVRVALYETIPGYSVKEVKFYTEDSSDNSNSITETSATLYTSGSEPYNKFYPKGTAIVYFPTVGTSNLNNSDYNKAHLTIDGEDGSTIQGFGNLNYTSSEDTRLSTNGNTYLAQASNSATYAGTEGDHYYTVVLPNETGTTLTLRVNYTLEANDGSGEEIKVYGASAIVPAIYAQWKSNYAYTYIFKISDNTNGKTGSTTGPEGLYPITFDAIVVDSEELTQSTITTVATPSITTYQKGHDVTKNEYSYLASNGEIYVTVHKDGDLANLSSAKLYTIEDSKNVGITEANIHDALTIGSETSGNVTTGRNGIELTEASLTTTVTTIPGVDGNNINVTSGTAASFTPTAGKTYAFVYKLTDGTDNFINTAYVGTSADTNVAADTYYTDFECTQAVSVGTDLEVGKTYYQKVTVKSTTYAIKVIKVQ